MGLTGILIKRRKVQAIVNPTSNVSTTTYKLLSLVAGGVRVQIGNRHLRPLIGIVDAGFKEYSAVVFVYFGVSSRAGYGVDEGEQG